MMTNNHIIQLENELNNINSIDEETKLNLINIFKSWNSVHKKHVFVENINNCDIKIGNYLEINGTKTLISCEYLQTNKFSLFIENCKNIKIKITNKFNHILLSKCNDIKLTISHGLISGIDILNSKNVSLFVKINKIYYVSSGNSDTCIFHFDETISNGMLMCASDCYKVIFRLDNGKRINEYVTNMSYFPILTYYQIYKNDETKNKCEISYFNVYGSGSLS